MKVLLKKEKPSKGYCNPDHKILTIRMAYPFFRSKPGGRIHRVRSGGIHVWKGVYKHHHFKLWCGNIGFLSVRRNSELLAEAPATSIFCATCEGRAIGAGMDGSRMINGRMVVFNPRSTSPAPNF